jgi:hypothetical protein
VAAIRAGRHGPSLDPLLANDNAAANAIGSPDDEGKGGAVINDNLGRLREAGVVTRGPIPEQLEEIVNDLSDADVDVIVKVMGRLDEAGARLGVARPEEGFPRWFTTYMVF